jgi:hypothetical protein
VATTHTFKYHLGLGVDVTTPLERSVTDFLARAFVAAENFYPSQIFVWILQKPT